MVVGICRPLAFGRATGGLGALIAWAIAGVGMLMLAFVFQTLARRKPELDAGIYAYAKAGFGDYLGFASAVGYWIGCCLADVACLVLIKATLGQFFPIFGDGTTPVAIVAASALFVAVRAYPASCAASRKPPHSTPSPPSPRSCRSRSLSSSPSPASGAPTSSR